jgi:tetratricopeptide (TPR) repeat protein
VRIVRIPRFGPALISVLAVLLTLLPPVVSAAERPPQAIDEARRLRDNKLFVEAVRVLERHLEQNPGDVEAVRLHAQTLYWLQDFDRARAAYASAFAQHPEHEGLRIEYARMLAETGNLRGARRLLEDGSSRSGSSADAEALLGTILYWSGDLTGAKRQFLEALKKAPGHQAAARQLDEIEAVSASWVRIAPSVWDDDQPLDRLGVAVEAGWFATPLFSLAFRSQPERYRAESARTFWTNEVELSHFAPAVRLETRVAAGVFRREDGEDSLEWVGRGELGVRADGGLTFRGRIERTPYLYTVASLDTPVIRDTITGLVQWTHRGGWLAEAAVQRQRFPDANVVRSAYAWVLAPIVDRGHNRLQTGYALSAADADEDRFVLARTEQPFPPSHPQFDFSGVYRPYYTPARVLTHSLTAAVTAGSSSGLTFRAGGSYGFHAREDATVFLPMGNQVVASIGRRSFTPWTARATFDIPASRAFLVSARVESGRSAFYRWTTGSVHLLFLFLPREEGRSPRR